MHIGHVLEKYKSLFDNILIFLLLLNIKSSKSSSLDEFNEALTLAKSTYEAFIIMFADCGRSFMPRLQFEMDDLKKYVNYPSKTTVGFAPKFTSNRKFFANLISTIAFKEMLEKDKEKISKSYVAKMKYCDSSIMDKTLLNDFYDREVDQNKI